MNSRKRLLLLFGAGFEDRDDPVPGRSAGDRTGNCGQHGCHKGTDRQGSQSYAAQLEIRRSGK